MQGPQETIPGETCRSYLANKDMQTYCVYYVSTKVIARRDVICERAVY